MYKENTMIKKKKLMIMALACGVVLGACGSEKKESSAAEPTSTIVQIDTVKTDTPTPTAAPEKKTTEEKKDEKEEQPDVVDIGKKPDDAGEDTSVVPEDPKTDTEEENKNNDSGTSEDTNNEENNGGGESGASGSVSSSDAYITIEGTRLTVGDNFSPYIDELGNPRIEEGQACLEGGFDTNYHYDGFSIYTQAQGGEQIIYDIYVTSSSYPTAKGISVGSDKDEVRAAYGEPDRTMPASDTYQVPDSDAKLIFTYSDGSVSGIDIC